MASASLNGVTAPDQYSPPSTLENFPITSVVLDVANSSIYWQVKIPIGASGGNWEGFETLMIPGSRRIVGPLAGIRFRAAIPLASLPVGGKQAVVTLRTS